MTTPLIAPMRSDIGEALLRRGCRGSEELVAGGYMAAISTYTSTARTTAYVPPRVARWLLSSLPSPLTDYQVGVVDSGHAVRVEYRDCFNESRVMGVYALKDVAVIPFWRGLAEYADKRYKAVLRENRRLKRASRANDAEIETLSLENDFLRSFNEHQEAFALYVEGGAAL
ncbi:MAG: hypothetical protein ACRYFX_13120 [Janthinobacterium lividum]